MKLQGIFLIIFGASLWGTIAFFVKNLYNLGFTPMEVVTLRVTTAALILLFYLICKNPQQLQLIKISHLKYFIGTGIFSIIIFNYCLFKTIDLASIPIATALLYTGPAFAVILSCILFQEKLTRNKIVGLLMTLIGTSLVVGFIPFNINTLPITTLTIGLASGFGFALYSIFSKFALAKYDSLTITTYTFLIASITLLPFFPFLTKLNQLLTFKSLIYTFGLGLVPTAIAYIAYTNGLKKTEVSKAAISSTIEPVIATLIGIFVFTEAVSLIQFIGIIFIISAVVFTQIERKLIFER